MKKILKYLALAAVVLLPEVSCLNADDYNVDPNNPKEVPSNMLMNGAEKWIVDNIYYKTFSGSRCFGFSQQWSLKNYTDQHCYQISESSNNTCFNNIYLGIANLQKVEELNTDPATRKIHASYGANCNQIAAAKILKVWTMDIITDTWGSVPYSEVGKLESDNWYYCKYDDQKEIYAAMIGELDQAVGMIDENQTAFTGGDVIYHGDASSWKKFGNSLKCRLAVHLSKVDQNWKKYISEAVQSGVFESNEDAACFKYANSGSDYCKFYQDWFVDGRNDYTISNPLCDILKGQKDTLNAKPHPWEGVADPRLPMFTTPSSSGYYGLPYGAPSNKMSGIRLRTPWSNWLENPPACLDADFAVPLMTYAELLFILSEYKGFADKEFKEGIRASVQYWSRQTGVDYDQKELEVYIEAVGTVNAEKLSIQKYIDLWLNGTEAWTEIRRTGYPEQLVRPGEKTFRYYTDSSDPSKGYEDILFEPLSEVKGDLIARVKYPTNESTLNGENWRAAVAKLTDGTNNLYSKMYWDVRTSTYDHPANK